MKLRLALLALVAGTFAFCQETQQPRRVVVLKVDGLGQELLDRLLNQRDEKTGHSALPWFSEIFRDHGTIFNNFYTRGISLSTPSWSMLDTGRHTIIRGNVEYDRYTGEIYDYGNFFPLYVNYARLRQVDMPGVEVLDRAGVPLLMDSYPYDTQFESFQLLQRGVRWQTLKEVLLARVKSQLFLTPLESFGPTPLYQLLQRQTEQELRDRLKDPRVLYLDFYTGDVDHHEHATNQEEAIKDTLQRVDALAGRLWEATQQDPLAKDTIFVVVSDHGMNNRADVFSQAFNLPDFFNSPAGGGQHVVTNRHQLDDYKLVGLDPLVHRVITPSSASRYLAGKSSDYPTVWLDLDGNERASVQMRNNDLNKIQILLQQLEDKSLSTPLREAAVEHLQGTIDHHRGTWTRTESELGEELSGLRKLIEEGRQGVKEQPRKWTPEQRAKGEDKAALRFKRTVFAWEGEADGYERYLKSLRELLDLKVDAKKPFRGSIENLVRPRELGDPNSVFDLQHYVVGPGPAGLVLGTDGKLDEQRSFATIDYFPRLLSQTIRNSPQSKLSRMPIDFAALRLQDGSFDAVAPDAQHAYWLCGGDDLQLVILTDASGRIALRAVRNLRGEANGRVTWTKMPFVAGLPLHLFEDAELRVPGGDRERWLQNWHSEREWLEAIHRCRYSDGVIGVIEEMSPVEANVPGPKGSSEVMLRYERRRRALVQADFHLFASDGWNFNVRNFNPGGNHGSFLRISTHSVWMMAGAGIPKTTIDEPYDSLNFASTILHLAGKTPPMPDRVVELQKK